MAFRRNQKAREQRRGTSASHLPSTLNRHTVTSAQVLSRDNAAGLYAKRRKQTRRRGVIKAFLFVFLGLAIVLGVAFGIYAYNINSRLTADIDAATRALLSDTVDNEPFYMLLLGTDKDEERESSGDFGLYRSDTIILARVDPGSNLVTLVSIPRDTYVYIEGVGYDKINAAYAYGGASLAIQTVEDFAGVDISHYAEVDMDGFAAIVDAIGGVTVDLPVDVIDPKYTGLNLSAGVQTLDGTTAALLARTRHAYDSYGGGDYYRAANQRMLIGAMISKMLSSDPVTIASTISIAADYITTDMNVSSIVSLATMFVGFDVNNDFYTGLCPVTSTYISDLWYDLVDETAWFTMMQRVDSGLPPYTDEDQDFTSGIAGTIGVSSSDESLADTYDYSGTVMVLNASYQSGIATELATRLAGVGYSTSAGNAPSSVYTTTIYYNGSSAKAKARGVAASMDGDYECVENDGTWDTSVDVVVVLGIDY